LKAKATRYISLHLRPILVIILIIGPWVSVPAFADIEGSARAIDGDTLDFSGQRVRLHGIDAPERNQKCWLGRSEWSCGQASTRALKNLIEGAIVRCSKIDRDRYGRIIGKCHLKSIDIGQTMVADGMALAYRKYSSDYVAVEIAAKAERIGIWKSNFTEPWHWRRGKRLTKTSSHDRENCKIKGNISRSGVRIYHMPGGTYYGRTRITESKGERWFCSEKEAREGGWRKSKR
jgi:endonuclease YncB( thermonuclease family)